MSKTPTPRVALIKESDDEIIDPFAYNWPILDTVAGARMVAAGVTPPSSELFDGCIVSEATTGKAWIARSDGIGGFTKQWLFYPWQCYATSLGVPVGTGTTPTIYGSFVYQASQSINSSAADFTGGLMKAPVAGIYEINLIARWAASGVAASYRSCCISYNSITTSEILKTEDNQPNSSSNSNVQCCCSTFRRLNANSTVGPAVWQNTGGVLSVDFYLRMSLVKPL